MQANLDAPLTLDPQQAVTLIVRSARLDFVVRQMQIEVDLIDSTGKVLQRRTIVADGSAVQTYITNQESLIYTRLLAKLGVTGTVA